MTVQAEAVAAVLADNTSAMGGGALELAHMAPVNVAPDQLASIGAYVAREYGDYGYSIEYLWSVTGAVTLAQVRCSDGGRFIIAADRWSNVRRIDSDDLDLMAAEIAAMHNNAVRR